ncbi:MAG: sigma 54-interacting transcriptional regulator, partial [Spirochaetia bacterium]|nr:sigma 54-interacting transcriptional regulator [Spirochaetia bacterium]
MKLPGEYKLLDQIQNTADLILSDRSIDRIIGQDHAVDIVKLASMQRRFLLIAGEPGTGKSMLGRAAADMMKTNFLNDVIAYENSENKNLPEISIAGAGSAVKQIQLELKAGRKELFAESFLIYSAMAALAFISGYFSFRDQNFVWIFAASIGVYFLWKLRIRLHRNSEMGIPKILVNREPSGKTPFIDATGSGEGALLGDVRHDPYQSGGMETPPHQLLEAGAIHHADGGVLYIDEISMLSRDSQQSLLTAIQDKKMPITGRSPGSSGMMIRSE